MIDKIESKRIINISGEPDVTDDDFVVIDGKNGTRCVPVANLLVKSGEDIPSDSFGVKGMLYLKKTGNVIDSVYYKIEEDKWVKVMPAN